ncbi:MAG: hypothetical protein KBG15_21855 [Kofleriaceae bacterium]|nr:hypothetical protein [Kofleriaceae bacterium]
MTSRTTILIASIASLALMLAATAGYAEEPTPVVVAPPTDTPPAPPPPAVVTPTTDTPPTPPPPPVVVAPTPPVVVTPPVQYTTECDGNECVSRPINPNAPQRQVPVKPPQIAFGFEFGYGKPQDPTNIYGDGLGATLVVAIRSFELRAFEYYDLEDKTGTYNNARGAQGQLGISSLAYRHTVKQAGAINLGVLIGGAWLRRSSLRYDEDDAFANDGFERHSQHGIGALLGGGAAVRVGPVLLGLDARIYPTLWASITGMRASDPGPIETIVDSPTGMPITVNGWVTFVVK